MKLHFYAPIVTSKLFFDNKRLMNAFEVFAAYDVLDIVANGTKTKPI